MVTTVGTEKLIEDLVKNLLLLEHDAVAAYEPTIEKPQNRSHKQQVAAFRENHLQHVSELKTMASQLKVEAPTGGDLKQLLTKGKIALAGVMGDAAILMAMKTNENETVSAYVRASRHSAAKPETRRVFESAAAAERRHRAWMERTSRAS